MSNQGREELKSRDSGYRSGVQTGVNGRVHMGIQAVQGDVVRVSATPVSEGTVVLGDSFDPQQQQDNAEPVDAKPLSGFEIQQLDATRKPERAWQWSDELERLRTEMQVIVYQVLAQLKEAGRVPSDYGYQTEEDLAVSVVPQLCRFVTNQAEKGRFYNEDELMKKVAGALEKQRQGLLRQALPQR